jgi:LPS export ABC transporter protein LptC
MQRLGLIIVPGVIAIALFVGINSLSSIKSEPTPQPNKQTLDFSAYAEGINTVLYDTEGNINYTLQAEHQIHYNNSTTQLKKPFIRLFQDGDSRWNIVANSGNISSGKTGGESVVNNIQLVGDVQAHSLDSFGNKTLMSTEFLTLNPDLEILETDNPVSVATGALQQSSVGMVANLRLDEFTFLRKIKGKHAQTAN